MNADGKGGLIPPPAATGMRYNYKSKSISSPDGFQERTFPALREEVMIFLIIGISWISRKLERCDWHYFCSREEWEENISQECWSNPTPDRFFLFSPPWLILFPGKQPQGWKFSLLVSTEWNPWNPWILDFQWNPEPPSRPIPAGGRGAIPSPGSARVHLTNWTLEKIHGGINPRNLSWMRLHGNQWNDTNYTWNGNEWPSSSSNPSLGTGQWGARENSSSFHLFLGRDWSWFWEKSRGKKMP